MRFEYKVCKLPAGRWLSAWYYRAGIGYYNWQRLLKCLSLIDIMQDGADCPPDESQLLGKLEAYRLSIPPTRLQPILPFSRRSFLPHSLNAVLFILLNRGRHTGVEDCEVCMLAIQKKLSASEDDSGFPSMLAAPRHPALPSIYTSYAPNRYTQLPTLFNALS